MGERIIGIIMVALWGPLGLADQNPFYPRARLVPTYPLPVLLVVLEKERFEARVTPKWMM